jgi:hypothetical protein
MNGINKVSEVNHVSVMTEWNVTLLTKRSGADEANQCNKDGSDASDKG